MKFGWELAEINKRNLGRFQQNSGIGQCTADKLKTVCVCGVRRGVAVFVPLLEPVALMIKSDCEVAAIRSSLRRTMVARLG